MTLAMPPTAANSVPPRQNTAEDRVSEGVWKSSLLNKRVAAGAVFTNEALTFASSILKSECARVDAQLVEDYTSLLRGNAIYIHNFLCDASDDQLYRKLKAEVCEGTGATMSGPNGLIEWSKHQIFENPHDLSQTFNDIIDMLAEYFDVDVYATRLNYYRDGTQWKTQHHDSHAYGGRAEREDITVGLTLGATRSLLFIHEASKREFNFPQLNGDCFAFTGEVNKTFTHGVPRVHSPIGDRFSIIAWGRRRTLNERNGGVPANAAADAQLAGRKLDTVDDAVAAAMDLVARQPRTSVEAQSQPTPKPALTAAPENGAATAAKKKKKNRLQ